MEGIHEARVSLWLEQHVPAATAPFSFELIAGGRSNLTYRVQDSGGHSFVLRRPPLAPVLATAHDMGREHRIISCLGPTKVPVPLALGYCDDEQVNTQPFYVMDFVDGHVLRDPQAVVAVLDEPARWRVGESLVEVLGAIHSVDPEQVGLADLGRRDGYIHRQLRRWNTQFQQSQEVTQRGQPVVSEVHDLLASRVPEQGPATIVHGDYRLDNTVVGGGGEVRAVLDWELCTLGDPLADLGLLMVYWAEPGDPPPVLGIAPTTAPGFMSREQLKAGYVASCGRDLASLDFYVAFGYWKLACILEGIAARAFATGRDGSELGTLALQVTNLAETAQAVWDAPAH